MTSVAPEAPKLYDHEIRVAQKAAGGLGGAVSPLAGPWQSPGGGSGGEVPNFFWLFDVQKT